ncbi:hypothetical protein ACWD4G_28885 [Streptomyces sp. NPDC002643]
MRLASPLSALPVRPGRAFAGGALLAVGVLVTGVGSAHAATSGTATSGANYTCVSSGCGAPGPGSVPRDEIVGPDASGQAGPGSIQAKQRPVQISCKTTQSGLGTVYRLTVSESGWSGTWDVASSSVTGVNSGSVPTC